MTHAGLKSGLKTTPFFVMQKLVEFQKGLRRYEYKIFNLYMVIFYH